MKRMNAGMNAILLGLFAAVAVASGCATENKVIKGPHYTLSHPDFWKVQAVATKDGEPTIIDIGRYSDTVVTEGTGSSQSAVYETSQAEVHTRIYTWSNPPESPNPSLTVANLLRDVPELELPKHGRIVTDRGECGAQFVRKYNVFGEAREPLDLGVRPGFRTIVVGAKKDAVLTGIIARVPYEQDPGLFCHNLTNMQTQLQLLLEGLVYSPGAAAAPAAPAAGAEPAKPAEAAAPEPAAPK